MKLVQLLVCLTVCSALFGAWHVRAFCSEWRSCFHCTTREPNCVWCPSEASCLNVFEMRANRRECHDSTLSCFLVRPVPSPLPPQQPWPGTGPVPGVGSGCAAAENQTCVDCQLLHHRPFSLPSASECVWCGGQCRARSAAGSECPSLRSATCSIISAPATSAQGFVNAQSAPRHRHALSDSTTTAVLASFAAASALLAVGLMCCFQRLGKSRVERAVSRGGVLLSLVVLPLFIAAIADNNAWVSLELDGWEHVRGSAQDPVLGERVGFELELALNSVWLRHSLMPAWNKQTLDAQCSSFFVSEYLSGHVAFAADTCVMLHVSVGFAMAAFITAVLCAALYLLVVVDLSFGRVRGCSLWMLPLLQCASAVSGVLAAVLYVVVARRAVPTVAFLSFADDTIVARTFGAVFFVFVAATALQLLGAAFSFVFGCCFEAADGDYSVVEVWYRRSKYYAEATWRSGSGVATAAWTASRVCCPLCVRRVAFVVRPLAWQVRSCCEALPAALLWVLRGVPVLAAAVLAAVALGVDWHDSPSFSPFSRSVRVDNYYASWRDSRELRDARLPVLAAFATLTCVFAQSALLFWLLSAPFRVSVAGGELRVTTAASASGSDSGSASAPAAGAGSAPLLSAVLPAVLVRALPLAMAAFAAVCSLISCLVCGSLADDLHGAPGPGLILEWFVFLLSAFTLFFSWVLFYASAVPAAVVSSANSESSAEEQTLLGAQALSGAGPAAIELRQRKGPADGAAASAGAENEDSVSMLRIDSLASDASGPAAGAGAGAGAGAAADADPSASSSALAEVVLASSSSSSSAAADTRSRLAQPPAAPSASTTSAGASSGGTGGAGGASAAASGNGTTPQQQQQQRFLIEMDAHEDSTAD